MVWRFTFPDVDGGSEKIADFSYICSYYSGATIPVPDAWFSPYPSTQYYSFQHYGAALMGRVLLLPPGSAYNIGYCLLVALGGTSFWGAVFLVARKARTRRAVVLACFVIGGTGMTIIDHLTDKDVTPWTNMRFIGSAQMDKPPLGPWLKAYNARYPILDPEGNVHVMELPGEIYSYVVFLGDYHAPLSGYYLLGLCAMGMLLWTRNRRATRGDCRMHAHLDPSRQYLGAPAPGARHPPVACGQLARLEAAGAGRRGRRGHRLACSLGLPFGLHGLGVRLRHGCPPGALERAHAPASLPALPAPDGRHDRARLPSGSPVGRRLSMLWLTLLMFTEYFYVDDEYSGLYDRFNTTLKWWPWVMAGTLSVGPLHPS